MRWTYFPNTETAIYDRRTDLLEVGELHQLDGDERVVARHLEAEAALGVRRGQSDQRFQRTRRHWLGLHKRKYALLD